MEPALRLNTLRNIEGGGAPLLEIAEFENTGAKLRKATCFGQSETTDLFRSLLFGSGLYLLPIMLAIPLPIGPMLHLINPFRLHGDPPIPCYIF